MARTDALIIPATSVPTDAVRDCLNEAFSDYLIRMPAFELDGWRTFLDRQGIDLNLSRVAAQDDRVLSFALVTPRSAACWRIAVMGARPEARGSGIAPRLLDDCLSRAQASGLQSVELEVFAQNERAHRLYRSRAMLPVTTLFAFEAHAGSAGDLRTVRSVSAQEAARRADQIEAALPFRLPWQVGGEAIRRLPFIPHCWQHGSAQIVFSEMTGLVLVLSLLDDAPSQADAATLLGVLRGHYPDAALRAPQLQADQGAAIAFRAAGWAQAPLYQRLMQRTL